MTSCSVALFLTRALYVATHFYRPGMGRRLSKSISNQGLWAVPGSTVNGAEPLSAGDRVEHYYYDGWELVERRGPGTSGSGEGTPATGQWVYGVTRIDEPLRPAESGPSAAKPAIHKWRP
ncbi:MAG: hypothetical protein SF069_14430 [Phycisphaerae bacterium]|nr:hypothetical protein [Phycisphaerae bacterium]